MAGAGKLGGDRVLESRHLVGLFLGVVLLCGVFFTLGYVMGRTQYGGSVHAADAPFRSVPPASPAATAKKNQDKDEAENPPAAPGGEWDFYSKKDDNHLEPAPKTPAAPSSGTADAPAASPAKPVSAARPPSRFRAPSIPKGAVVLQLAALKSETDALALADAVQQKKFSSFVVAPASDGLYRVQVGPYRDEKSAEAARDALAKAGFNAIIKR